MSDDPLLSRLTVKQEQKSTVKSLFDDDDDTGIIILLLLIFLESFLIFTFKQQA